MCLRTVLWRADPPLLSSPFLRVYSYCLSFPVRKQTPFSLNWGSIQMSDFSYHVPYFTIYTVFHAWKWQHMLTLNNIRQKNPGGRRRFKVIYTLYVSYCSFPYFSYFVKLSPVQWAQLLGLWDYVTEIEFVPCVSPSAFTWYTLEMKRNPVLHLQGFITAAAPLIRLAYLHGFSLFGFMEMKWDRADSVYQDKCVGWGVCVCVWR